MDFFEHQERARRNTFHLTLLFIAAVILIIIAVYIVALFLFSLEPQPGQQSALHIRQPARLLDPMLFAWTAVSTLLVISLGTVYKISTLAAGGRAVAEMFGAKQISPDTTDPAERRLLNVVEEIAIASGLPIPAVYALDEDCINAFAAGFSPKDAIIGVTRGCLKTLSRDELQAVIAHEFSHVLYGDMRLNLRLMGILHGILLISLIGYFILRISGQSSSSQMSGSSRRKGGGNTLVFILLGLALMIIGYIGVFFARLIKSAVSRQREFLADAASVQFTRNPGAMTGALKKIGGLFLGGRISHPNAEQASHMFFAEGLRHSFFNLMATHPPLIERIRRIEPDFDGVYAETIAREPAPDSAGLSFAGESSSAQAGWLNANRSVSGATGSRAIAIEPSRTTEAIGAPPSGNLAQIRKWLADMPEKIRAAARQPESAQALIFAMLVSEDEKTRTAQLRFLSANLDGRVYADIQELTPAVKKIPEEWKLPTTDLAVATLKSLSKSVLRNFRDRLKTLVETDGSITLFEYMIECMVSGQIKSWTTSLRTDFFTSDERSFHPAMQVILSTLAYYGKTDDAGAASAYAAGLEKLSEIKPDKILPRGQCGLQPVDKALNALNAAAPQIKKRFLEACSACISSDGRTTVSEAELLRAISSMLDCPIPPFLPDEPKA